MKTLQVGKSYKDACGDTYSVEVNKEGSSHVYPFKGVSLHNTSYFTANGKYTSCGDSVYDLIIPDEPEQTTSLTIEQTKEEPKVPHLDVILAIVQKIPVQYDYMQTGTWHDYSYTSDDLSPVNYPEYNWRIKPQSKPKRTVQIGKRTVVAPEAEAPAVGTWYHKCFGAGDEIEWLNDTLDNQWLESGLVFLEKQNAINCQEAISTLLIGAD